MNPWVLPHPELIDNEDCYSAGAPSTWAVMQGFYLRCGGRWIVTGSWFDVPGLDAELSTALVRIGLDIEKE
nr:hypothetical protein [Micromonospora sp. DSM 115978]